MLKQGRAVKSSTLFVFIYRRFPNNYCNIFLARLTRQRELAYRGHQLQLKYFLGVFLMTDKSEIKEDPKLNAGVSNKEISMIFIEMLFRSNNLTEEQYLYIQKKYQK